MTRKEQVAALVAAGRTSQEIAEALGISIHTVRHWREPNRQKRPIGMRQMVAYLYKRALAEDKKRTQPIVQNFASPRGTQPYITGPQRNHSEH